MMNKTVLILGASSDIAMAVGKTFAKNKHPLILAARNTEKLLPYIYDLQIRFQINIDVIAFDATDFNSHKEIINRLPNECETAICAVGYMGNQEQAIIDTKETLLQIQSNYTGLVNILNHLSNHWKQNSIQGKIIGITSVAGERGRMSNYIYGSAKAGFTT